MGLASSMLPVRPGSVNEAVDIKGKAQGSFAIGVAALQSPALPAGIYDIWCSTDAYIQVAADASGVTTANGYLLRTGQTIPIVIREQDKIGAITSGPAGTFSYHFVGG